MLPLISTATILAVVPYSPIVLVVYLLLDRLSKTIWNTLRSVGIPSGGEDQASGQQAGAIHLDDEGDGEGGHRRSLFSLFVTEEDILEVEGLLHPNLARTNGHIDETNDGTSSGVAQPSQDQEQELTRDHLEALLPPPPKRLFVIPLLELISWSCVCLWSILDRQKSHRSNSALDKRDDWARRSILATWLYMSARQITSRSRLPPWSILLLSLLLFLNASIALIEDFHSIAKGIDSRKMLYSFMFSSSDYVACSVLIVTIIRMPIRAPLASVLRDQARGEQRARPHSPEDENTLLGRMTYSWMDSVMSLARTRPLLPSDVWSLALANRAEVLARRFNSLVDKTLTRRILRASARDIAIDVSLKLVAVSLMYLRPYFIQRLLEKLSEDVAGNAFSFGASCEWTARDQAYIFGLFAFLAMVGRTLAQQQHFHHARQIGMRLRSELTVAVYEKALRRKDVAGRSHANSEDAHIDEKDQVEQSASRGKVVALISDDTNRVLRMGCDSHLIYGAPLELVWGLSLLYNLLGWPTFVGLALMLCAVPIHYGLGKRAVKISIARSKARDVRQSALQELISSIRTVKFFGWSDAFIGKVSEKRDREMRQMVRQWINNELFTLLWSTNSILVPMATLLCYVKGTGKPLTVAVAFTAIELFQMIREPLITIPSFWLKIVQCKVSIDRIESFLNEEDVESHASPPKRAKAGNVVAFDMATLRYHQDAPFVLRDLSIRFSEGLSVISGPTGSGKTSVLLALLGEMQVVQGSVSLPSAVSFASQNPWLESGTVRDSILFGSAFDQSRYDAALHACALHQDVSRLPDGDSTYIGERGLALSGGQKSRVALARALYAPTKVLLLDDVLSAVDSGTARHLFDHALTGPLVQGRTVILVTHHVGLVLRGANYHIIMDSGRFLSQGPVKNISQLPSRNPSVTEVHKIHPDAKLTDLVVDDDIKRQKLTGVADETWTSGSISRSIYATYFADSSYVVWFLTLIFLISMFALSYVQDFWIRAWAEASYGGHEVDTNYYFFGYLLINIGMVVSVVFMNASVCVAGYIAAKALFRTLLTRVVRAQPRWFDVTPLGRILNRFTNDVAIMDDELAANFANFAGMIINLALSFGVNAYILPSAMLPIVGVGSIYLFIFIRWLRVSRDLNRIAATTASPLFSGFQQVLVGISTIRAFGREKDYRRQVCHILDDTLSLWYASASIDVWIQYRTQLLSCVTLLISTILSVYSGISPGLAGIAINASQQVIATLDRLCNFYARVVLSLNSLERITEYLEAPQEPNDGEPAPASWPSAATKGSLVEVQDLVVQYAPDLPPTLKGVSFSVMPGERIAIVGRTGAGKSTLAMSLLRVVDPVRGSIIVDGLDITRIDLDDLRSRITILPQDAVLFSGTLRYNLDPFDEHSDEECLDALRRVHIIPPASASVARAATELEAFGSSSDGDSMILNLRSPVAEGGENFSQGQRQLVAVARALLRNPVVLILDESTASLDSSLDAKLQATLREQFQQTAIITIAHRLGTIIDSSRVIVMDAGRIVECDSPKNLLHDEDGLFTDMCRQSGELESLKDIAMRS